MTKGAFLDILDSIDNSKRLTSFLTTFGGHRSLIKSVVPVRRHTCPVPSVPRLLLPTISFASCAEVNSPDLRHRQAHFVFCNGPISHFSELNAGNYCYYVRTE